MGDATGRTSRGRVYTADELLLSRRREQRLSATNLFGQLSSELAATAAAATPKAAIGRAVGYFIVDSVSYRRPGRWASPADAVRHSHRRGLCSL